MRGERKREIGKGADRERFFSILRASHSGARGKRYRSIDRLDVYISWGIHDFARSYTFSSPRFCLGGKEVNFCFSSFVESEIMSFDAFEEVKWDARIIDSSVAYTSVKFLATVVSLDLVIHHII